MSHYDYDYDDDDDTRARSSSSNSCVAIMTSTPVTIATITSSTIPFIMIRKFFTKEDVYNVHKILGTTCLLHFIYRMARIYMTKDAGFKNSYMFVIMSWILLHATLSASSLIFHLPSNRVTKRPMIYPEFRMHSILFSFRCLAVMFFLQERYAHVARLFRGPIVLLTMLIADAITRRYRTATPTMRGMPFGPMLSYHPVIPSLMTFFYSMSQVMATMNMLFAKHVDVPFVVLFPIQIAAFLMTCVRKGVLSADGWHLLYTAALILNYLHATIWSPLGGVTSISRELYLVITAGFCILRFVFRVDKYVLWMPIIAVSKLLR